MSDFSVLRSWLPLVAPGILVTRAAISLAFIVTPWLTQLVEVAAATRLAAAVLLLAQVSSTINVLRQPGRWSEAVFATFLILDFLLCGVLLGAERQLWGASVPFALVILATGFEVAGWATFGVALILAGAGSAAAVRLGIDTPLVWPDTVMFGTVLSVETAFAGSPAVDGAVMLFPTALHVETSFGGVPGVGWTPVLLLPALALALVALGLGVVVSVVRVQRASAAFPSAVSIRRGGAAGLGLSVLLLASVSMASAPCDPSGRAEFIKGLAALSHGDLPAATRIFFQLAQEQPACPEVRNNLAVLFVEQDRLDEAAKQLRRALKLNPDYERARINLARVEALLKDRQGSSDRAAATATPEPSPTPIDGESAGGLQTDVTSSEVQPVGGMPTETPHVDPAPTRAPANENTRVPGAPPTPTVAERRSAAVCVIEPAPNRICVYHLGAGTMVAEECYPITVTQVRWWPRSLVASEVTAQQIRLIDESGQTRLEIVPDDVKVSGDALHLRKADWQALAARVLPWRTAWLVAE